MGFLFAVLPGPAPAGRDRHLRFGLRAPSIIKAAYRSGLYASGPGPTSPVKSTAMVANGFGRETVGALDVGVANLARPRIDRRDRVGTERLVGPQHLHGRRGATARPRSLSGRFR